jgi:hypothetical protein
MKRILSCGFGALIAACSSSSATTAAPLDAGGSGDDGGTVIESGAPTSQCTAASAQLLGPIKSVSSGVVTVLSDSGGVKKIYIDASAGGTSAEATKPRVYVDLAAGTKVSVTDVTAGASTAWDLSFKRPVIFTNDGDGGPGMGGATLIQKTFASVTASDAASAKLDTELFFDGDCNPKTDQTGSVLTTLSTWYSYDQATHALAPATGTWLIRGGTGTIFKMEILSYYATATGGTDPNGAGGTFLINVAAL